MFRTDSNSTPTSSPVNTLIPGGSLEQSWHSLSNDNNFKGSLTLSDGDADAGNSANLTGSQTPTPDSVSLASNTFESDLLSTGTIKKRPTVISAGNLNSKSPQNSSAVKIPLTQTIRYIQSHADYSNTDKTENFLHASDPSLSGSLNAGSGGDDGEADSDEELPPPPPPDFQVEYYPCRELAEGSSSENLPPPPPMNINFSLASAANREAISPQNIVDMRTDNIDNSVVNGKRKSLPVACHLPIVPQVNVLPHSHGSVSSPGTPFDDNSSTRSANSETFISTEVAARITRLSTASSQSQEDCSLVITTGSRASISSLSSNSSAGKKPLPPKRSENTRLSALSPSSGVDQQTDAVSPVMQTNSYDSAKVFVAPESLAGGGRMLLQNGVKLKPIVPAKVIL